MTSYIVKRVLLMIPTLFLVALLAFLVLNLAPGSPAQSQMSQQGTESTQGGTTDESYQIFKKQFNLDKPILLNLRFWLDREDVAEQLAILADKRRDECPQKGEKPEHCIPPAQVPSDAAVINASRYLNDWGYYIVPELYRVAQNHGRLDVRRLAVRQLSNNAQADLITSIGRTLTDEQRRYNKIASDLNDKLEGWSVPADASASVVDRKLEEHWKPWLSNDIDKPRNKMSHREKLVSDLRDEYRHTTSERVRALFVDTRFAAYLGNLVALDFGISHVTKRPVAETLWTKVGYTIWLTLPALLLAFFISVPIGVWSATQRQTIIDQVVTTVLLVLYSLPTFLTGVVLLSYLAAGTSIPIPNPFTFEWTHLSIQWFPAGGFVGSNPEDMTTFEYLRSVAWHLFLPIVCLTYPRLAGLSRYARTGIVDVIEADYIRTARAKGLPESMVIGKHAVRNGMIPTLTILGTQLPRLIGGSIVIESIFEIPGMGTYLLESIQAQDYNALMGILLVSAVLTLIGILVSDISYALVDPRISFD